ncbi:MAG: hypothetical protein QNJ16_02885 [Rhodobacter sp.]|nr:hypothetical protein [Rhodobacter sp.]
MFAVADTDRLVHDAVITADQARIIEARARETMVSLGINAILTLGILFATGGLIVFLANAVAVAVFGALALGIGLAILFGGSELYRMFGTAAALIGAGMLLGGATVELLDTFEDQAGSVMAAGGLVVLGLAAWGFLKAHPALRFVMGAIFLMGLAMHLGGLAILLEQSEVTGFFKALFHLYAACLLVAAGALVDVRFVTALAIVPFAQMLETGTAYWHAVYVFYSPEPTLSILQMAVLVGVCVVLAHRLGERLARHARVLAVMGFVVANLSALVGSLWGDVVGETLWGPGSFSASGLDWEAYEAAREAFLASALAISENVFSILWAVALVAMVFWAAHANQRGLFNASLTFGAIHAYTQFFESFGDEPLAYVIGGLAAIPLAWGMWRFNQVLKRRAEAAP